MEYKEIVSVTGEPGLFQLLSSKSDGAIVRSLDGKATRFVPSRNHNFTPLESIEVFTTGENVPLSEVFRAMQEKEGDTPVIPSGKSAAEIRQYFEKVYPELDKERVYMSDMKKMLKWYPVLKENDLLKVEEEAGGEEEIPGEKAEAAEKTAAAEMEEKTEAETPAVPKDTVTKKEAGKAKKTGAQETAGGEAAGKKTAPASGKAAPARKKAAPKKSNGEKS